MEDAAIADIRSRVAKAFEDQTHEDPSLRGAVDPPLLDAAVAVVVQIRDMGKDFEEAAILELDELVHESMEEAEGTYQEKSDIATGINNSGLEEQVACVMIGYGETEGALRIREAANLPSAAPSP